MSKENPPAAAIQETTRAHTGKADKLTHDRLTYDTSSCIFGVLASRSINQRLKDHFLKDSKDWAILPELWLMRQRGEDVFSLRHLNIRCRINYSEVVLKWIKKHNGRTVTRYAAKKLPNGRAANSRAKYYQLTPAGHLLLDRLEELTRAYISELLEDLNKGK